MQAGVDFEPEFAGCFLKLRFFGILLNTASLIGMLVYSVGFGDEDE